MYNHIPPITNPIDNIKINVVILLILFSLIIILASVLLFPLESEVIKPSIKFTGRKLL